MPDPVLCLVPFGYFPRFGDLEESLVDRDERFAGELGLALNRVAGRVAEARCSAQQFAPEEPSIGLAEFLPQDLVLLAGAADAADMGALAVVVALLRLHDDDDTRVLISRLRIGRDASEQAAPDGREKLAALRFLNRVRATTWFGSEQEFARAVSARDPDALVRLAHALTEEGRLPEAEQAYRDAIVTGDSCAVEKFAWWLQQQSRLDEALDLLREQGALVELAAMAARGKCSSAMVESVYRDALDAGVDARYEYSLWLREQGRDDEAEHAMRQSLGDLTHVRTMLEFGFWLELEDRCQEAEEFYREAAKAGDRDGWEALGSLLNAQGQRAEAKRAYLEAIALGSPDALDAFNRLHGVA